MWAKYRNQDGFTIVELLVVIVVIGILAAVTIVAYNGIQDRARASTALTDATTLVSLLGTASASNGTYPNDLSTINNGGPLPTADGTTYVYHPSSGNMNYCATVTNGKSSFRVKDSATTPVSGGCPGDGVGGVAAVTNYAQDPDATSTANFGQSGASPASSTPTIATNQVHHGTTSFERTLTGAGQTGAAARIPSQSLKVLAGTQMSWSFWVYSSRAGSITPWVDGSKVADSTYIGCGSTAVTVPVNTWTLVTGSCAPSADMYPTQAGGYNLAGQSGDTIWFDQFMVQSGGTLSNYADGNSSNWIWNGTPNNSTSTGPPQ